MPKNWCFQTLVLEKTHESPLESKEIKPVNLNGNQPWIFIGRTDAEIEVPILWPPDVKNWLIGEDPDAGKDWGWEEKGTTEDEMVGWHHRLTGHEFEQAPGIGDGQESLACCSPWGHKELDMTEWLNWTDAVNSWLNGKVPHAGEDWGQKEEKGMTEDEMVGWHHRLNGHESEQAPELVMDREAWLAAAYGSQSQIGLRNWTGLRCGPLAKVPSPTIYPPTVRLLPSCSRSSLLAQGPAPSAPARARLSWVGLSPPKLSHFWKALRPP